MIKLETKRLILRDYVISDLEDVHKWMSDSEVMHYLDWKTCCIEDTRKDLIGTISEINKPNRKIYFFAIIEKETQKHVGGAGFSIRKKQCNSGIAEFGYFLLKEYWGKGIAVEAVLKIIEFGFTELSLHKLSASCDKENKASEKVMQKCGLIKEGELRKEKFHRNKWCDRLQYSILIKDWKK
jgi:[ribosomal protein S5]-alanine N-acetyltransferase